MPKYLETICYKKCLIKRAAVKNKSIVNVWRYFNPKILLGAVTLVHNLTFSLIRFHGMAARSNIKSNGGLFL
jgi:hypothetical protein